MNTKTERKLDFPAEEQPRNPLLLFLERCLPADAKGLLDSYHFADIFSSKNHSEDFKARRAEYIQLRIRWLTLMFAIAIPLWIPIDYFTLTPEHFASMIYARAALALALGMLYRITHLRYTPSQTGFMLFLIILLPSMFYIAGMLILDSGIPEVPLAGYAFQPFLLVCFSAIFPLTLLGSLMAFSLVFCFYITTQSMLGNLFTLSTMNGIWMFCLFAGAVLWAQYSQLHMLLQLYRESTCDYLTGLLNRRLLVKRLDMEVERSVRESYCFSLMMIDLDRFKRINDQYGHSIGDRVLVTFGKVLTSHLRESDVPARYGGEEFMVLLPGADRQVAECIAQRLRIALQNQAIPLDDGTEIFVTASIGITEYERGENPDNALNRVDEALYQAKKNGRNCVVVQLSEQRKSKDTLILSEG